MDAVKIIRNEEYLAAAEPMILEARRRIDICTFKFEISRRADARGLNRLIQALYSMSSSRVSVKVLLNITGRRGTLSRLNLAAGRILQVHNIDVRYLPDNRCQHAKILLVDKCQGIIGSHNWSYRSMTENFEASVAIYHAGLLARLQAHFEKIWESSQLL